jgi:hypothetical protein
LNGPKNRGAYKSANNKKVIQLLIISLRLRVSAVLNKSLTFNPIREELFSKDHSGNYIKIIPAPQKRK